MCLLGEVSGEDCNSLGLVGCVCALGCRGDWFIVEGIAVRAVMCACAFVCVCVCVC